MNELMQNVTQIIHRCIHRCIEGGCNSQHHISVTNIESAMKHIKSNTKDGFDDVSTSHLIHASSVLKILIYVCHFFLQQCYTMVFHPVNFDFQS